METARCIYCGAHTMVEIYAEPTGVVCPDCESTGTNNLPQIDDFSDADQGF